MAASRRGSIVTTLVALCIATLLVTPANAYRRPRYLVERPLETATRPARLIRSATHTPAITSAPALAQFEASYGAWQVLWDDTSSVPTRIWGAGIAAPGATNDAAEAARVARTLLDQQLGLLAPGGRPADFTVDRNVLRAGVRSVVFAQRWNGLDVVGATIRFTIKHDRVVAIGSTASPTIHAQLASTPVAADRASAAASAWIERIYGGAPVVLGSGAPVVLPIYPEHASLAIEHRVVVPVQVELQRPRARWTVYVDAASGAPVARRQELRFGDGTVKYRVSPRYPTAGYSNLPAAFAQHKVNNVVTTSNAAGLVTWTGTTTAAVAPSLVGSYVAINNDAGALASTTLMLAPANTVVWDLSTDEFGDAQLGGFVHANIAKQYARRLDPDLAWLGQQMQVFVNENDVCNAYSELDAIHFLRAGDADGLHCENSARVADIVYHEFGHSLHAKAFGSEEIDGALSEGIGDYYGATITGDSATGTGWIVPNEAGVRDIDPPDREYRWPDDINADPHMTGLIISGALWDLRKALIGELGMTAGVNLADDVFYGVISRADDIPSSYAEALVTDDDDGNLANGTPHKCAIDRAFGRHGLGEFAAATSATHHELRPDHTIHVEQLTQIGTASCPSPQITSIAMTWRLRSAPDATQRVDLAADGTGFAAPLPTVPDGEVFQYQLEATLDDGGLALLPHNPNDRWYEAYFGPTTPIYCTDFEQDPTLAGWKLEGFQWGAPAAGTKNDPDQAFDGTHVIGTNLTGDGAYPVSSTMKATSPPIQLGDARKVRLQYRRWLSTEDAVYDPATIRVDAIQMWGNVETEEGGADHVDGEWRFHDIDLASQADDAVVQVSFELSSDDFIEYGGWNIDSFCVVAQGAPPACPGGPDCDDPDPPPGEDDSGCCSTGKNPTGSAALALLTLGIVIRRRRRS